MNFQYYATGLHVVWSLHAIRVKMTLPGSICLPDRSQWLCSQVSAVENQWHK